jgi:hypothetical protein
MGLPLYAKPSWKQYRHLIAENPEYAYTDYAPTIPLESYYNGINTLREKTIIALNRAGGLMLFDVNEDTNDEASIVSMIDNILARTSDMTKEELSNYVTIVINNRELAFLREESSGMPYINNNGKLMIPLRKSLEYIGAEVSYDSENKIVTAKKDAVNLMISIGENQLKMNNQNVKLDTAAIIKDNRTYIPLRDIFTVFDYNIEWHENSKTAFIWDESLLRP